ncbi:MAG: hypothetical protein K8T89_06540 [Planctomycetes bacterium]|nr:hypothetical protein [Planctomycetota bacterium]
MLRTLKVCRNILGMALFVAGSSTASAQQGEKSNGLFHRWSHRAEAGCTTCTQPNTVQNCQPAPITPLTPKMDLPKSADPIANQPDPTFSDLASGAGVGSSAALAAPGGYLDSAIPKTTFRLRYERGTDMNRPDRAEYFYAQCFGGAPQGIRGGGTLFNPNARGPAQLPPPNIDFQQGFAYFEYAFNNRFSAFADMPYREVDFNNGSSPSGFSDLQLGIKAALVAEEDRYLTFQFRTYIPTGVASDGLGTAHVSLEPSLLYFQRLNRVTLQAQLTDWIPVGGGPIAGNVLQYGAGVGYDLLCTEKFRFTPVAELMGWTALSGFATTVEQFNGIPGPGGQTDAAGQTIVNAKIGARTYFGKNDVYVGYGHAITGNRWYNELVRIEYRRSW